MSIAMLDFAVSRNPRNFHRYSRRTSFFRAPEHCLFLTRTRNKEPDCTLSNNDGPWVVDVTSWHPTSRPGFHFFFGHRKCGGSAREDWQLPSANSSGGGTRHVQSTAPSRGSLHNLAKG